MNNEQRVLVCLIIFATAAMFIIICHRIEQNAADKGLKLTRDFWVVMNIIIAIAALAAMTAIAIIQFCE